MKQLLLRVPDEIHSRLAARAARDGRSVNALATDIIDAAVDADEGDRRSRLRVRARATGLAVARPAEPVTSARRSRLLATTRGLGAVLDVELDRERARP